MKEVCNIVGGHVKHNVVSHALQVLSSDATGFWEYPDHPRDRPTHTHHPFLNVILIAMLQAGDREHKDLEEVRKIPGVMASLIHAIAFIDNLFQIYIVERRLL